MERIDKPILVVVENEKTIDEPTLSLASVKVLHFARTLTTGTVAALSVAQDIDEDGLRLGGADVIYVPESGGYSPLVPAAIADTARAAVENLGDVGAVLTVTTYLGRAVTAMLATAFQAGGAVDVTRVWVSGSELFAQKAALGGAWETSFHTTQGAPVLAVRPGFGDKEGPAGEGKIVSLAPRLSSGALQVEVISHVVEPKGSRVSLTDADVVVAGGRGTNGDFTLVENLADALGGAVGATRVACDEGWVPRAAQIGQTGVTVAPKLFVGLGVSGAVHHTCGMLGSQIIVAVVDDPDAPIIELADFTVVGDVSEVVPQALEILSAQS